MWAACGQQGHLQVSRHVSTVLFSQVSNEQPLQQNGLLIVSGNLIEPSQDGSAHCPMALVFELRDGILVRLGEQV